MIHRAISVKVLAMVGLLTILSSGASAENGTSEQDFMVAMRDGVKLATTVYLPEGDGPWPIVLTRTPYNKAGYARRSARYTDAGYAFVIQDCRGQYASEGVYVPFEDDMEDGYDTVEWLAEQDFSNGKIGMSGGSAMGITSNLAAAANPPHLVAAYVIVAPQSLFYESRFIGGVFKESHAGGWMRGQGVGHQVSGMKKRVVMDDQWMAKDLVHHLHKIDIPIYNVGGWYDIFLQGNINNFMYLQDQGLEGAKGNQKLHMGPFGHGQISGDLAYEEGGGIARNQDEIRWFDYWLKDVKNGIMDEPPVRYYMMASAKKGAASDKNRWLQAQHWPPESNEVKLYLREGKSLSTSPPLEEGISATYRSDPSDPVPTVGGQNLRLPKGPMDQRAIGMREDYLRFETEPLEEDVVVAGPMSVNLWVSTDGLDTDFMVKLVDVYPDGYEAIVVDCPIRARFRHGRTSDDVEFMTSGKAEELTIDLWSTALTFEKGHKIALHVSSSNHPRFEINANNGDVPGEFNVLPRVAENTIYYDVTRQSALTLPVVD